MSTPLGHRWALYCKLPNQELKWNEKVQKLSEFDTIESFWSSLLTFAPPSSLRVGNGYYLFRDGIAPEWEHGRNKAGGHWEVKLLGKSIPLNDVWTHMCISLAAGRYRDHPDAGGPFPDDDTEPTGMAVAVSTRGMVRFELWMPPCFEPGSFELTPSAIRCGRQFAYLLQGHLEEPPPGAKAPDPAKVVFEPHGKDAKKHPSWEIALNFDDLEDLAKPSLGQASWVEDIASRPLPAAVESYKTDLLSARAAADATKAAAAVERAPSTSSNDDLLEP